LSAVRMRIDFIAARMRIDIIAENINISELHQFSSDFDKIWV
jgi:hypothetical protein